MNNVMIEERIVGMSKLWMELNETGKLSPEVKTSSLFAESRSVIKSLSMELSTMKWRTCWI